MTRDDRLRIAVFIDFDNIEIGVKNTMGANFDAGLVLEALKERGDVVSKTAYSDWQRAGGYSRSLTQHAIKMVQRNLTPGGDKNGADINLALDALEMAFTHPHINAFVIVGGDSDFISLVEKLKQYDKKVFVVGGRQFSSIIMQKNCHEFIAYENLVGATAPTAGGGDRRQRGGRDMRVERQPIEQALPLVTRALKVLSEREVSPQLGLLKSTLLQLDSTFSERTYGAGSFRDFVEKLEKVGVVKLQQSKGGWLVIATEEAEAAAAAATEAAAAAPIAAAVDEGDVADEAQPHGAPHGGDRRGPDRGDRGDRGERGERGDRSDGGHQSAAPAVIGSNADGIREFRRILATGQVRRWPMYLRNVKQVIRSVSATFDERAYGFANLADLLRAAGREGIVRVDRDRQGVIRVFQGSAMPSMAEAQPPMRDKAIFDIEDEIAAEAANAASAQGGDFAVVDETVIVVDENAGTVNEYPVATHPAVTPPVEDDEDEEDTDSEVEEEDDSQLVMLAKAQAKAKPQGRAAAAGRSRRPARGPKPAAAKEPRARAPRKRR